jgi:hypothetical protein
MRRSVNVILAGALALAAMGCERREPRETSDAYDPELDGALPVAAVVEIGEDLAAGAPAPGPTRRTTPSRPARAAPVDEGTAVEQVKAVMQRIAEAGRRGDLDAVLSHFAEPELLRPIVEVAKRLPAKASRLERVMEDRLGSAALSKHKPALDKLTGTFKPDVTKFAPPAPEECTFRLVGQDVEVRSADSSTPVIFTKASGSWKIDFPAEEKRKVKPLMDVMGELAVGVEKVLDGLIEGVEDGSVTGANFEQRAQELGKQYVKPAAEKLMGIMMGGLMEGMGEPPRESPESPESPSERPTRRPRRFEDAEPIEE